MMSTDTLAHFRLPRPAGAGLPMTLLFYCRFLTTEMCTAIYLKNMKLQGLVFKKVVEDIGVWGKAEGRRFAVAR